MNELNTLKEGFSLCVSKKLEDSTVSISYSDDSSYLAGSIASDTNSLNVSSEQASLILSILNKDYKVKKIVTLTNSEKNIVSPIIAKIMVDHSIRTGIPIAYKIINIEGSTLFETENITSIIPFYKPEKIFLSRIENSSVEKNCVEENITEPLQLRKYAIEGLLRNFPLYDSASGYGTAVTTKKGNVYFGGQYSSPDKRVSLHSEVNTIMSALMNGDHEITQIGIVSSKYTDTPCNMCGICRQFISEMSAWFELSPKLYCFAKENPEYREYNLEEYLPSAWTSKKWKK